MLFNLFNVFNLFNEKRSQRIRNQQEHCDRVHSILHLSRIEGTWHFVRRTHGGGGHSYLQTGSGFTLHESLELFLHSGTTGTTSVAVTHLTHGYLYSLLVPQELHDIFG